MMDWQYGKIEKRRSMKVTKLEHSGLVLEENDKLIVFDPVEYVEKLPELKNVVAVIITHKHGDHLQIEKLTKIIEENPNVQIFTTADTAPILNEKWSINVVKHGDTVEIEGFRLKFFGENHAEIVPGIVPCQNIGVIINDAVVNPGDSFDFLPIDKKVKVLCAPVAAPWLKSCESMSYVRSIKPAIAIPMHDALLSEMGKTINNNWLKSACGEVGTECAILAAGDNLYI